MKDPTFSVTASVGVQRGVRPSVLWAVLIFAMVLPTPLAWIYFVFLAKPPGSLDKPSFLALAAYAASKVVQFAFPLIWVVAVDKRRLAVGRPRWDGVAFGAGFGALVFAAALLVYQFWLRHTPILALAREKVLARLESFHVASPARYLVLAIFIACMHSLMEEYYWRWFVFGELKRLLAVPAAVVVSSLGFMAHHVVILWVYFPNHFWTAAMPFALCVAAGGAVWAWIYHRAGTLYAAWLSHFLADAAILVIGYEMVFVS
jgi:membrane protease YdiL (CAAX protease family)